MVFNFFLFGKKNDLAQRYSLKKIPLFSSLSDAALNSISSHIRLSEYRKGDIVFSQDDVADAFYVVTSGRCRVFVVDQHGKEKNLAYYHKGDYFGAVSLLTEKAQAANVQAINDTIILKINKNDFLNLINTIPSLSLKISRRLGLRIKKLYEPETINVGTKIISLFQQSIFQNNIYFGAHLAAYLTKETQKKVLLLDCDSESIFKSCPEEKKDAIPILRVTEETELQHGILRETIRGHATGFDYCVLALGDETFNAKDFVETLTDSLTDYHYIIINTRRTLDAVTMTALEQSDLVYIVSDANLEALNECKNTIESVTKEFNFTSSEMRVLLYEHHSYYHEKAIAQIEQNIQWKVFGIIPYLVKKEDLTELTYDDITNIAHADTPYGKRMRFFARELGDVLVGLALGCGSAFGFAHIGVLKVLEKEKIPIDIIAGCSIGSVIGALWASGYSAHEIENIVLRFRKKRNLLQLVNIFDLCAPHVGFLSGNTIVKFMKRFIGKKEFKDLQKPMVIVATDLQTSEDYVFKTGRVVDAIRASISIPGIIKPFRYKDTVLIDGGVTNPLPINLLREEGVKNIIAVNVLPSTQDIVDSETWVPQNETALEGEKKGLHKKMHAIGKKLRSRYSDNIFNVLMCTVQYLEAAICSMQQNEAEVIIHPYIMGSHWAEFYEPEKFIKEGEARAEEVIADIRAMLQE